MRLGSDCSFALRMLGRTPGFTLVAIVVLALGVGLNTAIFSVVHSVLLRPLPYEDPDRLYLLWESIPQIGFDFIPTSNAGFLDWKERSEVFSGMAFFDSTSVAFTDGERAEELKAIRAHADLFSVLGVEPQVGRSFRSEESEPGGGRVAILSHGFWQRRFGGRSDIAGQEIRLDGELHTVVGVLSARDFFPPPVDILNKTYSFEPEVFIAHVPDPENRGSRGSSVLVRLKDGVSADQARAHLQTVAASLSEDFPNENPPGFGAKLFPLHAQAVRESRMALYVLLGAVGLILLIACVNVANLLLVRASTRIKEVSIRLALGAGRTRVIRQLLIESLLLALAGSIGGVLLAFFSLDILVGLGAGRIPGMGPISINSTVLLFSLALAIGTGLLFGLFPSLQLSRPDLVESLKESSRGNSSGLGSSRLGRLLVVGEVGLAVVLMVGAGLLLRSFAELQQVDLGFRPDSSIAVGYNLPDSRYSEEQQLLGFHRRVGREMESLPGVTSLGFIDQLPLSGSRSAGSFDIQGRPQDPDAEVAQIVDRRRAGPGYFEAMGIPILSGREFSSRDTDKSETVFLLNRTVAERYWPDESPIDAMITFGDAEDADAEWGRVVGVVDNVKHSGLDVPSQGAIYRLIDQSPGNAGYFVLKTGQDPSTLTGAIQDRVNRLDPELPIEIRTIHSYVDEAQATHRSSMTLLLIFAGLALTLSVVGLYGVVSFIVGNRTPEIGVRMAIGARPADILRSFGWQTLRLILAGVAIGLLASYGLSGFLSGLIFEVSPADPWSFGGAALLFTAVACAAGFVPTRRASRIDPVVALRND